MGLSDPTFLLTLKYGWKRELVYRTNGSGSKNRADVYYHTPEGRKVRKQISHCDICQNVKHPNSAYEIEPRSHLPTKPGELISLDLYCPLPTGRGGAKYILVCLDYFQNT
jgi:hypothetical protein